MSDEPGRTKIPERLRRWLPGLAIAALVLVFFSPYLFQGKVFLAADTLYQFFPWRSYAPADFKAHNTLITDPVNQNYSFSSIYNQQLKQGKFATWSPYVLAGIPAYSGRSYPLNLLYHYLFPTLTALSLLLMTHLLLMGAFMYLYLREIGAGARGAVLGAAAFMFNGCAMVWLSYETVIPTAAYVPLLLLLMERYLGPRRYFFALAGALVLGLVITIGHVQYTLYVGMIMLLYGAFLLARVALRRGPLAELASVAACGAVTAAGGALVGALELLPTWGIISYSSRVERSFDFAGLFATLGRIPYRWLVTLVFPDYYGSPVLDFNLFPASGEYVNYNEFCLYLGVPTLFALVALAVRPRTAHARFFLGLTAATVAMLAGSVLFYPFFKLYPGLDKLAPERMIYIFVFAACVAAGLGVRNIEEAEGRWRTALLAAALALTGGVVVLALASSSTGAIAFFSGPPGGRIPPAWVAEQFRGMRSLSSPIIAKPLLIALASGTIVSLWVWFGKRRWAAALPALLIALLGYDLISFGWGYNALVEPAQVYPTTPSLEFLRRQPGPFRVVADAGAGLFVNSLQPFEIQEIGGYTSVYPERVNKLMSSIAYGREALAGRVFDRWVMFRNVLHPLFDLLNVRYILTAPGVRMPENPKYRLAFTGDMTIYENTGAFPRAFPVHRRVVLRDTAEIVRYMNSERFDPRGEVVLEEQTATPGSAAPAADSTVGVRSYGLDTIELDAAMAADGWVVLTDTFYPGWEAKLDGRPAPILRADAAFRAVAVPAGAHRVVFSYRPAPIAHGRAISALALASILGAMAFLARREGLLRRPPQR